MPRSLHKDARNGASRGNQGKFQRKLGKMKRQGRNKCGELREHHGQTANQVPKRGPAPRTLGARNWHIRCKPPDTHPHRHKNSLHTPGPKSTGEGQGRATDSTSEPQSTQNLRDSNNEPCKQTDKQKQPEDRDKGKEAQGTQFNLGPRRSPENRQANPKRETKPIQQ